MSIRTAAFDLSYEGGGAIWDAFLRPIVGGPSAGAGDEAAGQGPAAPESCAAESGAREATSSPPVTPEPPPVVAEAPLAGRAPPAASSRDAPPQEIVDALLAALADEPGRRAERDAVLVAVWARDGGRSDVDIDAVGDLLGRHEAFADVRTKPIVLKHVSRTRLLEFGRDHGTVRLTRKGRRHLAELARG